MTSRSLYARAARAVLAHRSLGVAIVIGSLMHASGHALLAAAGGVLARALAGGESLASGGSSTILHRLGAGDAMLGVAIVGLFAAIAKMVGGVLAGWAEARVAGEVSASLRLEVLDDVLAVNSLRAPRQGDHGEAQHVAGANIARVASLTTHVTDVEKGIVHGLFAEVRAVLQLLPLGVLLVVLAPRLAGSAALALGAFAVLVLFARRALKKNHARASRETEALLGAADEAVRHADLWATYGAESRVRSHVGRLGRTIIATTARLRARTALLSGTSETLGALALVLTLALVSAGAISGVSRGAIVPFAIAFFMAYKPLRELVEGRLARAKAEDALARIRPAGPAPSVDAVAVGAPTPAVPAREWSLAPLDVRGLATSLGTHAPLTFRVEPGAIVAIVGVTGIGKTSLLRALLGLDSACAGTITWGGEDLTHQGVGPRQRPFAWVPQDAPILGDTLVANVVLGHAAGEGEDTTATSAAANEAVTMGALDDLGADGLAASLGSSVLATDRTVSGGERQWIAVARALATRLPVLLLDEPTSSLDGAAQERMLAAVAGLRGKRTVILVTHRTEPLAIADVVVRLEPCAEPNVSRARSSHRHDAQHGPGRDAKRMSTEQLAIEDVSAVVAADVFVTAVTVADEVERELARERVDVLRAD